MRHAHVEMHMAKKRAMCAVPSISTCTWNSSHIGIGVHVPYSEARRRGWGDAGAFSRRGRRCFSQLQSHTPSRPRETHDHTGTGPHAPAGTGCQLKKGPSRPKTALEEGGLKCRLWGLVVSSCLTYDATDDP